MSQIQTYENEKIDILSQISKLVEEKRQLLAEEAELEANLLRQKLAVLQKKDLTKNISKIMDQIKQATNSLQSNLSTLESTYFTDQHYEETSRYQKTLKQEEIDVELLHFQLQSLQTITSKLEVTVNKSNLFNLAQLSLNCKEIIKEQNLQVSAEATKLHTENETLRDRIASLRESDKEAQKENKQMDEFISQLATFEESVVILAVRIIYTDAYLIN